jgi:hypothetical protein
MKRPLYLILYGLYLCLVVNYNALLKHDPTIGADIGSHYLVTGKIKV